MNEDRTPDTPAGEHPQDPGQETLTRRRLQAEGPFQRGDNERQTSTLLPSPAGQPFPLVPTHQGVVTSRSDAEWLLVRTTARIQEGAQLGLPSYHPDHDDQRALVSALAGAGGLPPREVLDRFAPLIDSRVQQMQRGPAAAEDLGRNHGRAGTPPYCDLDLDGDSAQLLHALEENEDTTDANYPYRMTLLVSYAEAYRTATAHRPPASSPAQTATLGFPLRPSAASGGAADDQNQPSHVRQEPVTHSRLGQRRA